MLFSFFAKKLMAQLVGAVEYTDCISAEGSDSPNEYPGYDTKPSDVEAPLMLEGNAEYLFYCHCSQVYSGLEWKQLIGSYL